MCMPSPDSNQPSLAYSSSSSSITSQLSSPPQYAHADDDTDTVESNTYSSWGAGKHGIRHFVVAYCICFGLSSALLITALTNVESPFCNLSDYDPDSISASPIDSKSKFGDMPSKSHHRGKSIGANVKAADLAAAYQSIKSEYAALAQGLTTYSSTNEWKLLSSHADGSEVSLLEHPTDPSCPYVRMTSIMPGSVKDVWDFLDLKNWERSMPKIDPYYEGLVDFGDYKHKGIDMKLARKKTKKLATFGKRDFTFLSVSERLNDGWVSGTVSVIMDRMPREKGYVRGYQDSISHYKAMENDDITGEPRMKLTMMFRLDLNDSRSGGDGGNVPMWLYKKTAGATAMASVQNMKRQLELNAKDKKLSESTEETCEKKWLKRILNGTKKC